MAYTYVRLNFLLRSQFRVENDFLLIVFHKCAMTSSNDIRHKVCIIFQKLSSEESFENIAKEIEQELFNYSGDTNKQYRAKVRSLKFNLKRNPKLISELVSNELTVFELVNMTTEELLTAGAKQARDEAIRKIEDRQPRGLQYRLRRPGW